MIDKPDSPAQEFRSGPRIVVIGVGGAGGNAVNNMISAKLAGVEFVTANTDAQALGMSLSETRIQMGRQLTQGLGAGSRPDIGCAAAEEALEEILDAFEGANMVFITAGMGGGTGTGSAPIIAKAARESGVLTIGVVTKPFDFEGTRRMALAEAGIQEMALHVDTLIVIPNQNLFRIANEKTTFADAFRMADDVLHSGVRGITDLMVTPGLINLDFADVRTVMTEMGKAIMGSGEAEGENRALAAAEAAILNPLLDEVSMKGARGVLINITGGMDLTLFEIDQAANRIRDEVDPDANIIFGSTFDENMAGRMRVSMVAAGIDAEDVQRQDTAGSKRPIVSLYAERLQASARETAGAVENDNARRDDAGIPPAEDEEKPGSHRTSAPVFPFRARARDRKALETSGGAGATAHPGTSGSLPAADQAPEVRVRAPGTAQEAGSWPGPRSEPRPDDMGEADFEAGGEAGDNAAEGFVPGGVDPNAGSSEAGAASEAEAEPRLEPESEPNHAGDQEDTPTGPALVLTTLAESDRDEAAADDTYPEERPAELPEESPVERPVERPDERSEERPEGQQGAQADADIKPRKAGGFFSWISNSGGQAEDLFKKADRYYHGQGVRKDLELAFQSYLRAAEAGHPGAQNRVGWMYEKGEGVPVDYALAVKWYRKSAEQGYVNAMNDLGYMYRQGWGVPQNHEEALLWFEQAASKYDSYAEYNMGQMFENGWGVEKDMDEAVRWFRRSAARGHEWAAKRLEELGIKT